METNMNSATESMWTPTDIEVVTKEGRKAARGLTHAAIPGLAVTTLNFGHFEVTHVASGMKIVGPWERFGGACLAAVHLAACLNWDAPMEVVRKAANAVSNEPCPFPDCTVTGGGETRPMTKRELFETTRNWIDGDEFPWESDDEDPFVLANLALDILRGEVEVPSDV